jgi:hydroxymethylpyrimidine/phosphomethylpyrimidine kinase
MMARLLVIAGSDSSAGAGLQADLKTAEAFGVYAQTAVTAVTAQTTQSVMEIFPMPPALVRAQIEAALSDIGADAIKMGMLGNGAIASAVADALEGVDLPLVLDPVLVSTSGKALLDEAGVAILKERLLPKATLLTPNLPEVGALIGMDVSTDHGVRNAMQGFALLGCRQVLFKGGHGGESTVRDVLGDSTDGSVRAFVAPRQQTRHTHGTGCTLATAIACGLAQGKALEESVARAQTYVQEAIRTAPGLGEGQGPLNHRLS